MEEGAVASESFMVGARLSRDSRYSILKAHFHVLLAFHSLPSLINLKGLSELSISARSCDMQVLV